MLLAGVASLRARSCNNGSFAGSLYLAAFASFVVSVLPGCRPAAPQPARVAPPPLALFLDVAHAAGIDYRWSIPGPRPLNILQTIGNGCAFLDFDNDGNLDILLVGPKLALYKGDGHGRFTDVTHETGLDKLHGHFLGCAVGDYDNDGYDDIYITAYRGGVLLHNEERPDSNHEDAKTRRGREAGSDPRIGALAVGPHPPTASPKNRRGGPGSGLTLHASRLTPRVFRDVTAEAGLKPVPWGTSAAFAETVPGSGRLDLYVCNYAVFGPHEQQLCEEHGVMTSCGPRTYTPLKGVLYRNLGGGRFADATRTSGLASARGRGLGVGFADLDDSGRPGAAIANDEMPGDLMQPVPSRPAPAFTNVGDASGTAYDRDGNVHGGMGLDWGDYDNDGRLDLFVATFQNEPKALYHNDGSGHFADVSAAARIALPTTPFVAFGCKLFDYDNDGWLDLAVTNGHVQDNIAQIDPAATYRQSAQLFHNLGATGAAAGGAGARGAPPETRFEDADSRAGPDLRRPIVGRGLAVGDFDNDGREDLLIVDSEGAPLLLHNQAPGTNHWLGVKLIGTRCNRDGYGAMLTAECGGRRLLRLCHADGSYMSSSDRRVHFGLGAAARVDTLTVRWPDGHTDNYRGLPADRYVTIREGDAKVR